MRGFAITLAVTGVVTCGFACSSEDEVADPGGPSVAAPAESPSAPDSPSAPPGSPPSGSSSGAPGDPPVDAPPPGKVAMFVAQGTLGRTTVSCDDGKTWVGNHSWDVDGDPIMCGKKQDVRCGTDTCSYVVGAQCVELPCCNDTGDIPEGVAYGAGVFVGTWGHGKPGLVKTSKNGIDWVTTHPNPSAFGGIVYGGGRFVATSKFPIWSLDGTTWTDGGDALFSTNGSPVRAAGYGDYAGGSRVVAISAGNSWDMLISSDGAATWWRPATIPATCGRGVGTGGGDILSANGALLVVDQAGNACRSVDGGTTWTVTATGATTISGHGMWTGKEFVYWSDDNFMLTSPDGVTWTKTPMVTKTRIGPVARAPNGTFVAIRYLYDRYENQHFLRSTDGLTWETLPTTAFLQSHSIFRIAFGWAEPSALCPLPPTQ